MLLKPGEVETRSALTNINERRFRIRDIVLCTFIKDSFSRRILLSEERGVLGSDKGGRY
jgi:hypothetical protein